MTYNSSENGKIEFYADADFDSDTVDYKSLTGNISLFHMSPVS